MKKKLRIVCLYQVIMHYRLPFYKKISADPEFDFKLFYGRGKEGTKLINVENRDVDIKKKQLYDIRLPLPFTPTLFFHLVKENPDIVFSEGSSSLINASIAFLYSKIFRKKFIWWSLGALKDKHYRGIRKLINKWELVIERNADAIFTYSTLGKQYFIKRGVVSSKIFVGVNVFDTEEKLREINSAYIDHYLDRNFFNIGFIGTIQKTKNLELLVDAVEKLNMRYMNVKLHIIGDGPYLLPLKKYVRDSNVVIFYGRMNRGSSKILGNCDVLVLPGLGGLAICEGMLNKLPIVTGNADGTEYDLVKEDNGFIIENMNLENLCEKIEYLYNNPKELEKMGERSFERITGGLSFGNYYAVFKSMIAKITEDVYTR